MNLEQIAVSTLNGVQMLLELINLPLAVGPISDADFQAMMTNYAELNWDFAFAEYGNDPNKFEFCVKLVEGENPLPAGAAMCIYNAQVSSFDIYFVESFVRANPGHPLHGRMLLITLMASYLFCNAVDCSDINVIEPVNDEVIALYRSFGFEGDSTFMTASVATIRDAVLSYT